MNFTRTDFAPAPELNMSLTWKSLLLDSILDLALNEIDIRGSQDKSLKEYWTKRLGTFAGIPVSGLPNMFIVCGPHLPAGKQPTMIA